MLNIFNLKNYKDYLISSYFYECDNTFEKKIERQKLLEARYNDECLQEIIENTKEFVFYLLENCKDTYISIDMAQREEYLFTNLTGGFHPDVLISIDIFNECKTISKHLLGQFLGEKFTSYITSEEIDVFDDEDEEFIVGCIYEIPKFIITGDFSKKYEETKNEENNKLARVLKNRI